MTRRLTPAQARRLAVAAQGLTIPRPTGAVDVRHLRRAVRHVGLVQIDSVNVIERAHLLTLFSRIGPFDTELFRRLVEDRRELFEYWGHMASFNPTDTWPLLRYRMERVPVWASVARLGAERPQYVGNVLEEIREFGPLTVGQLSDPGERRAGTWWDWRIGKLALEWLFARGLVTVSHRTSGFARAYDITERVIPEAFRNIPPEPPADARRRLIRRAMGSLGVATERDLADYYRMPIREAREAVAELAASGELVAVEVDGWRDSAYLDPHASIPRRTAARALVGPFDSLIWNRERVARVFGFHFRVEIYVPQPRREYGYYVLPFLLNDRLVARVDLKADRRSRVLQVRGAYLEPEAEPARVARELADELQEMARWLGLEAVEVGDRGDLASGLADAVD